MRFGFIVATLIAFWAQSAAAWSSRRALLQSSAAAAFSLATPAALAADPILTSPPDSDTKKLYNEARALESQGNMFAAQRLYAKVTRLAPNFVYAWSSLGNTQTALGDLNEADASYTTAVDLCKTADCSDLYILLLNRGSLRLNNGQPDRALADLRESDRLRNRPDALVLQNLARAEEWNGFYAQANEHYDLAIRMTANEVNPFWLRSAMVKLQLGDVQGGFDLLKRVDNRFSEAPEVRAAYAAFLSFKGDATSAQQKFLAIPDRQRLKFVDRTYMTQTIVWPPVLREQLEKVTVAVGDGAIR